MENFTSKQEDVLHYHVSGTRFIEDFSKKFKAKGLDKYQNIIVRDYLYDMPTYMAAADVVMCRAGAMTLSEVATLGRPAVLVPSPHVTDDHQYKNAKVVADRGGALLVREEKNISEGDRSCVEARHAVEKLYSDKALREKMSRAISEFARRDTGKRIFEEILELIKK